MLHILIDQTLKAFEHFKSEREDSNLKKRIKLLECRLHLLHSEFLGSSCHYPTFNDPFTRYAEMELESSSSHESACCASSGPGDLRSCEKAELGSLHLEVEAQIPGAYYPPVQPTERSCFTKQGRALEEQCPGFLLGSTCTYTCIPTCTWTHTYPYTHAHTWPGKIIDVNMFVLNAHITTCLDE